VPVEIRHACADDGLGNTHTADATHTLCASINLNGEVAVLRDVQSAMKAGGDGSRVRFGSRECVNKE
jgi:hypothetical protein